MIKIALTYGPMAKVSQISTPLALLGLSVGPIAQLQLFSKSVRVTRNNQPLGRISVPVFASVDPRQMKDAAGDWILGADGQALWGAN